MSYDSFEKAKELAFASLRRRDRSEKELRDFLLKKSIASDVIDEVVAFLYEYKFLDDNKFAFAWAEYKKQCGRGPRKVAYELQLKGVAQSIVNEALDKCFGSYDRRILSELIEQKQRTFKKGLKNWEIKRKLMAFLLARGFEYNQIKEALDEDS